MVASEQLDEAAGAAVWRRRDRSRLRAICWLRDILPKGFTKIRHYGLMSASHATSRAVGVTAAD